MMNSHRPLLIGLTGNIGTGKSTVSGMLRAMGAEVIDADKVAHEVMRVGTPVHAAIARTFGLEVMSPGGQIDRKRLGALVFADPVALARLERIVGDRGLSRAEAEQRVRAQPPQRHKVAQADVVIDNSGSLSQTREQVQAAWERLIGENEE
jgi:dephospho-CoA kinase